MLTNNRRSIRILCYRGELSRAVTQALANRLQVRIFELRAILRFCRIFMLR